MATIRRTDEVKRFLEHLDCQTYRDFELIVVDQNSDGRLVPILESYKEMFPILHLRAEKGLSRARNVGLKHISGDIVAFPDDDCWYGPGLLKQVVQFFDAHPDIDGLTGRVVNEEGRPLGGRWDANFGFINSFNIWRRQRSASTFLRKRVIRKVGDFDEHLGAGSGTFWGSGEETDYLLKALKLGFKIVYDPNLVVYHPQDNATYHKALSYGRGMGYVLRKHRFPFWHLAYWECRSLGGLVLSLLKGNKNKASVYLGNLKGRIQGWWQGK